MGVEWVSIKYNRVEFVGFSYGSGTPPVKGVQYCQTSLYFRIDLNLEIFTNGMIRKGNYVYLDHLLYYDSWPTEDTSRLIISSKIHSPSSSGKWAQELLGHPDSTYVGYIVKGIDKGFRIGFDRRQFICSAGGNLHVD